MRLEEFESALRDGSAQVAEATRPEEADVVRAQGNRRFRLQLGAAVAGALVVALAGASFAAGGFGFGPARPSALGISRDGFSLRLVTPASYQIEIPNAISLRITNARGPRQVIVTVTLGKLHTIIYRQAVVARLDPSSGKWIKLPLVRRTSGWVASYPMLAPAGTVRQRLLLDPATPLNWSGALPTSITVRVRMAGVVVAEQAASVPAEPNRMTWSGSSGLSVAAGHRYVGTLIARNPSDISYRLQVSVFAPRSWDGAGQPSGRPPAGDDIQWLDGAVWRSLQASAYAPGYGQALETVRIRAHGQIRLKIRIIAGRHAPNTVGVMEFRLQPIRSSLPGNPAWYQPEWSSTGTGIITTG